jgi:hypothetical protein
VHVVNGKRRGMRIEMQPHEQLLLQTRASLTPRDPPPSPKSPRA